MATGQPASAAILDVVTKRGEVAAAGGLVTRGTGDATEVVLVHRPKYDDWTFPKGKVETGETDEAAAAREVREETGFDCTLGEELATVRYVDGRGRPKRVRYWMMTVVGGDADVPNDEVDDLCWLSLRDASTLLTYEHDQALARRLGVTR
jgi:8-oxo-dGTP pyrophosphatase MutT (NUDIX family)